MTMQEEQEVPFVVAVMWRQRERSCPAQRELVIVPRTVEPLRLDGRVRRRDDEMTKQQQGLEDRPKV